VRPSDYDATLRAAIERVVMSPTTIEIELAEGMASDDQNRILIIPWTPPSHHRRREIIEGEGERPSAMGPMRTEARAVLTDALRDAHLWLSELSTSANQTIELLAAREGKTERWIRRTVSLAFLCPALVKAARQSTVFGLLDRAKCQKTRERAHAESRPRSNVRRTH
jgi:site-specific DNA recombinase